MSMDSGLENEVGESVNGKKVSEVLKAKCTTAISTVKSLYDYCCLP